MVDMQRLKDEAMTRKQQHETRLARLRQPVRGRRLTRAQKKQQTRQDRVPDEFFAEELPTARPPRFRRWILDLLLLLAALLLLIQWLRPDF